MGLALEIMKAAKHGIKILYPSSSRLFAMRTHTPATPGTGSYTELDDIQGEIPNEQNGKSIHRGIGRPSLGAKFVKIFLENIDERAVAISPDRYDEILTFIGDSTQILVNGTQAVIGQGTMQVILDFQMGQLSVINGTTTLTTDGAMWTVNGPTTFTGAVTVEGAMQVKAALDVTGAITTQADVVTPVGSVNAHMTDTNLHS